MLLGVQKGNKAFKDLQQLLIRLGDVYLIRWPLRLCGEQPSAFGSVWSRWRWVFDSSDRG